MKSILFVPYFGELPEWWPLFKESLKYNPDFTWILFTDTGAESDIDQLAVIPMTFKEYCQAISTLLDVDFTPESAYKPCDARPVFGHLHKDLAEGYDFFDFCDIDLIFGDINACLPT